MEIAVSIVRREGELAREVCAIVREKRGDSRGESMCGDEVESVEDRVREECVSSRMTRMGESAAHCGRD